MTSSLPAVQETARAVTAEEWTTQRLELVKRTICKGASDDELALFSAVCQRTGLDPFQRQIFAVKRWDAKEKREVMQTQVSIDGLRLIAQRSGAYAGQTDPEWCGEDGVWRDVWLSPSPPSAARIGVLRHGFERPVTAVALFREYVQTRKDGAPNAMWSKYPAVMLAKCAESLALRKAFPAETSGIYTAEEMGTDITSDVAADAPVSLADQRWEKARERAGSDLAKSVLSDAGLTVTDLADETSWNVFLEALRNEVTEVPGHGSSGNESPPGDAPPASGGDSPTISDAQLRRLFAVAAELGLTDDEWRPIALHVAQVEHRDKIPAHAYDAVEAAMREAAASKTGGDQEPVDAVWEEA